MPSSRPRNLAFFSMLSLGGGYLMIKSRTLAAKQRERAVGDFSVSVDRSGMLTCGPPNDSLPEVESRTALTVAGGGI